MQLDTYLRTWVIHFFHISDQPEEFNRTYTQSAEGSHSRKLKLLQDTLLILLHLNWCSRYTERQARCRIPQCIALRSLYRHVMRCACPRNCCKFRLCNQVKILQEHYRMCSKDSCSVCRPTWDVNVGRFFPLNSSCDNVNPCINYSATERMRFVKVMWVLNIIV